MNIIKLKALKGNHNLLRKKQEKNGEIYYKLETDNQVNVGYTETNKLFIEPFFCSRLTEGEYIPKTELLIKEIHYIQDYGYVIII